MTPHFIMEFFPSGSLRLRIQAKDLAFIKEHARKIFKDAATGLAYMNATGFVHRDVKPDNMLVNSIGDTKMIDFAISKKIATGFSEVVPPARQAAGHAEFHESRNRSATSCSTAGPTSTATAVPCTN